MSTKIEKLQHKAEVATVKADIEAAKVAVAEAHKVATKAVNGTFDDFITANNGYVDAVGLLIELRTKLATLTATAKDA
jgi:hypothetical protein